MKAFLLAVCVIAVQTPYSQGRKKDPTVCDNATKGFNPHPTDCTQYVQCFEYPGNRVEPVYRNCEYGKFWNPAERRCLPSDTVDCPHDKCKTGVAYYKHSDPNKCSAYWNCTAGKAQAMCCPDGQGFHPTKGCIANPSCVDMCPKKDRVPGCARRPISGSPTQYEQYTDNGIWRKERCPKGAAYHPANCGCSLKDLIVPGKVCKPDVRMTFDKGNVTDISGNNYKVYAQGVVIYNKHAYFNGHSRILVEPLRPAEKDEGVLIIKMRYQEDKRRGNNNALQGMVTNGHCGKEASVVVGKVGSYVLIGAECLESSRTLNLPTVAKKWKEVIYIHDSYKLEGRVCGAVENDWSYGPLKDTGCGFQFGAAKGMKGYVGYLDDISIYRCKPLEAVINISY